MINQVLYIFDDGGILLETECDNWIYITSNGGFALKMVFHILNSKFKA